MGGLAGGRAGEKLDAGAGGSSLSYVESWLTTLPPFMVGVPELFLERPCFSPISCSEGSLYMHTARRQGQRGVKTRGLGNFSRDREGQEKSNRAPPQPCRTKNFANQLRW